jgi:hypothetical protein
MQEYRIFQIFLAVAGVLQGLSGARGDPITQYWAQIAWAAAGIALAIDWTFKVVRLPLPQER